MRPRLTVALMALALAGCANEPGTATRQDAGGFFGSATSGFTDSFFASSPTARATNASAGPTANGILSGPVGASLGERDRQRAYAAEMQALETGEPGEPTGWRGETPGRYGTIVPGAQYQARGTRCRDFTHTIYIDGRPQAMRSTACRNPDGSWSPVG
jgi:surface antigen